VTRVAFLANFIAPYQQAFFEELEGLVDDLRIFVSTPMEANRRWDPSWGELQVTVQRSLTFKRRSSHPKGYTETAFVHFPYDTLPRLIGYRPDVVISAELGLRTIQAAIYAKIARRRFVIRVTISEETELGRGRLRRGIRRILLHAADAVVVHGASGSRYVHSLGAPVDKICAVPHTIPIQDFSRVEHTRPEAVRYRLIHVGQLIERKGILEFLDCLAEWALAHPDAAVDVAFAGDGPLEREIHSFKTPSNVTIELVGPVTYSDLPDLYGRFGILLFPTLADSWGVVVQEAMAAGLPVLGSMRSEAVVELVDDGATGWVFNPDDRAQMLDALDRAMTARLEEIDRMGEAARQTALRLSPRWGAERFAEIISAG
jgi:glycosyltransferase involved in cell wall biosynthesis